MITDWHDKYLLVWGATAEADRVGHCSCSVHSAAYAAASLPFPTATLLARRHSLRMDLHVNNTSSEVLGHPLASLFKFALAAYVHRAYKGWARYAGHCALLRDEGAEIQACVNCTIATRARTVDTLHCSANELTTSNREAPGSCREVFPTSKSPSTPL